MNSRFISDEIKRFMIHPNKHANNMVIKIEKTIMTFLINSKLFRVSSGTCAGMGGIDENIMKGKAALATFQRIPNPIRPMKTNLAQFFLFRSPIAEINVPAKTARKVPKMIWGWENINLAKAGISWAFSIPRIAPCGAIMPIIMF